MNKKFMELVVIVDSTHSFFSFSNEEPCPGNPCSIDYFFLFLSSAGQYYRSYEPDSRLHSTTNDPSWFLSTVTGATVTKSKRSVRTTPSLYWTQKKKYTSKCPSPIKQTTATTQHVFLGITCPWV